MTTANLSVERLLTEGYELRDVKLSTFEKIKNVMALMSVTGLVDADH